MTFHGGIILISVSVMANEAEHLFMGIGYLDTLLCEAAALSLLRYIFTGFFFFPLLICRSSLYILYTSPLSDPYAPFLKFKYPQERGGGMGRWEGGG